MSELTGIFKQIEERNYSIDQCFLCGCQLNEENSTVEHVIPKWLQYEFNLWDQKITLLNGTLFPYKNLTIPCCFECNNIHLKPFEDKVKKAFENGFEGMCSLSEETLFYWLGKIYFGMMYRELFLNLDRADPEKGTITNPEYIDSFFSHFLFLQGIRGKHSFSNFFPASIYLFKTQKPQKIEDQWDFIDNHQTLFISIRMGDVGLMVHLQDCKATKNMEHHLDIHKEVDLHPLQFRELTAKILYKGLLMNRTPKFINTQTGDGPVETHLLPIQGFSSKPIFDDWDNDEYSYLMSFLTGIPLETCQPEKGKVYTWLVDENDEPIFIDVDDDQQNFRKN
ncbi:hypothetical protein LQ318_01515 [Aliifodinibius salicampi]|uniref:HNH endonuclease n=1 Tax=Fodinibius salicampi TaxID=1920655 RepID=A0ABT3PUP2_9BACT|nr:hypothetical protein [Fodinibius salicampi]MCW9711569.1 hypothetical protein [Fodinibius salicampi]